MTGNANGCATTKPGGYLHDVPVDTGLGQVIGFAARLADDFVADVFLGVPYAAAPIGSRRFEKPIPVEPFTAPYLAQKMPPCSWPLSQPPKESYFLYSEDCLYLNLIRPQQNPKKKSELLPVLVYVHGGGYQEGCARNYGYRVIGKNFASRDAIIITIQYRLSVLGFGSTGDDRLPGNLGYWDQKEAFEFIRRNVKSFGGDPERITAFGLSAGGGSVSALSISPHSRDLIDRFVEMSGSTLSYWALNDDVVDNTLDLAKILGVPDDKNLKEAFSSISIDEFYAATNTLVTKNQRNTTTAGPTNLVLFHPRIDGDFFPAPVEQLLIQSPPKPVIIGFTAEEAAYFVIEHDHKSQFVLSEDRILNFKLSDVKKLVKSLILPEAIFLGRQEEAANDVYDHYFGKENDETAFFVYVQMLSDIWFVVPGLREADLRNQTGSKVFLYCTSHFNDSMFSERHVIKGAYHGAEYPFMFGIDVVGPFKKTTEDDFITSVICDSLVNFARSGDPSSAKLTWNSMDDSGERRYVDISPQLSSESFPRPGAVEFWDNFARKYGFDVITSKRVRE